MRAARFIPTTLCILVGFCVAFARAAVEDASPAGDAVRVLSFNLFVGGETLGRPLAETAGIIRKTEADVVGLQETHAKDARGEMTIDNGSKLAALLGSEWSYLAQPTRRGILTRMTIVRASRGKHGALLRDGAGREWWMFNVHLPAAPYQPYMLVGIKYGREPAFIKTEEEAIRSARGARGKDVDALLADIRAETDGKRDGDGRRPVVVTGDFNEPSHEDWTDAAAKAGLCPIKVEYPTVKALTDIGFRDAYRAMYPSPIKNPGYTWTPTTSPDDPKDRHDRIDFVLARGVEVQDAQVVGEKPEAAGIVVQPWPSDHRAVLAVLRPRGDDAPPSPPPRPAAPAR
jgi:exonuclease III